MPEGPSLVILKEEVQAFAGLKIIDVSGNSKENIQQLKGQKIIEFKTWGKHFLVCFKNLTLRIHFLLFGKYTINDTREAPPRLSLTFASGHINFYTCSVKFIEGPLDDFYDWKADVLSDAWDEKAAKKKLKAKPEMLVCDALLDQNIFAGVGNIIKNEVLYRIKVHPENTIGQLPAKKVTDLVREARNYSFDFLEWKKAYVLRKHWLAHTKRTCSRDGEPIIKKHLGKTNRRTFYCET
ncbi:MAG TPA: DNA-formamidopyrimidine glycosylase family protein [Chitinophagaceae bacterium]|jgi:endonuclease-8|nr:DNA-formamidopyrimidine glycosylase family protein [Chitinophagaceae bacterium]